MFHCQLSVRSMSTTEANTLRFANSHAHYQKGSADDVGRASAKAGVALHVALGSNANHFLEVSSDTAVTHTRTTSICSFRGVDPSPWHRFDRHLAKASFSFVLSRAVSTGSAPSTESLAT